jgi:hypothetical protein
MKNFGSVCTSTVYSLTIGFENDIAKNDYQSFLLGCTQEAIKLTIGQLYLGFTKANRR